MQRRTHALTPDTIHSPEVPLHVEILAAIAAP